MADNFITEGDSLSANAISSRYNISPDIAYILATRFKTFNAIDNIFSNETALFDSPFLLKNMDLAVARLKTAIADNENIGVFCDSDLDGLTSLTIVNILLSKFNKKFCVKYPENEEGYGLTKEAIDYFSENKVKLLITLDSGIRDVTEIQYAHSKNIDVIVCDHHETDSNLPEAIIINPKQKDDIYPFKELAGVSVAMKFCLAFLHSYMPSYNKSIVFIIKIGDLVFSVYTKNGIVEKYMSHQQLAMADSEAIRSSFCLFHGLSDSEKESLNRINNSSAELKNYFDDNNHYENICGLFNDIHDHGPRKVVNYFFNNSSKKILKFLNEIIPYAAIGTIADVVTITNENHAIVKYGVKCFGNSSEIPLAKLKQYCSPIDRAKDIAWKICPLLNSPCRYGMTFLTANFFISNDIADKSLDKISEINLSRKNEISNILNDLASRHDDFMRQNFILIKNINMADGLTGLLAGRLADKYKKPSIVMVHNPVKDTYKGSGRSVNGFDFLSRVEVISLRFEKFGGHKQAFGFTISSSNLLEFEKFLESVISAEDLIDQKNSDNFEISIENINDKFYADYQLLEPFGYCNEEPVLILKNVVIKKLSLFGNQNQHTKILSDNKTIEIILWNTALTDISAKNIDIECRIEKNSYSGKLNLIVKDYTIRN